MRTFAFIFARGGSKGLRDKNVKHIGGLPLVAHSIRIAASLPSIEQVFVSTEDEVIADISRSFHATVIQRPMELATDTAPEWLAWQHAVKYVQEELKQPFDVFVSLPPTSPLRSHLDIQNCLNSLDKETDIVITVCPSHRSPYFNMISKDKHGFARLAAGNGHFQRRQDTPAVYDITTVAYVTRPDFVLSSNRIFDGRVRTVTVPKERAIDIDDEIDFQIAQFLYRL